MSDTWRRPRWWVEAFCLANLAFLALDVWIAHAANDFAHSSEWIPVYAGVAGTVALVLAKASRRAFLDRMVGLAVGALALAVGIAGMLFHLESGFFTQATLRNLVYTAPFAAPLAFGGIGFLLLLERMVPADDVEWGWWLWLLALAGWIGTFGLSLADHAQNGFFSPLEWLPVAASGLAVGLLVTPLLVPIGRGYLMACAVFMAIEVLVGLLGAALHVAADLTRPGPALVDQVLHGAPVFAPLLFANLAVLTGLALWAVASGRLPAAAAGGGKG